MYNCTANEVLFGIAVVKKKFTIAPPKILND